MTATARHSGTAGNSNTRPRMRQGGTWRDLWRDTRAALRWMLTCTAVLLVAACGGSDGTIDSAPPAAPGPAPAAPGPAPVARVQILTHSAWLPGNAQTRQLEARAVDAAGNPVSAPISWTSSRASHVAVDATGRLTSQVAAGSALITAQANGVASAPLLAYVAKPAAGVVLIDDANISGQPVETDPAAAPSMDSTYQVSLSGIAPPAIGTLLLGRGDKPLAGRVAAVTTTGAQTVATLQLVPLPELFADLEIEELIDLSRAEVLIPSDVEAQFNVARNGNTWTFAPKVTPTTTRARPQAVTGTYSRDILPFRDCEASFAELESATDFPIGFDPPSFSITLDPTLDYYYSRRGGATRFIVNAESKVEISASLKAQAALSGGLNCKLQLFALRLPIGGPLAFFVGGYLPAGVGFDLQASATLTSFKLGAQAEAGTQASLGWNCPPAGPECTFVRSMENSTPTIVPLYEAPTLSGNMRLEAGLDVFGYIEAELGHPLLRSLRFKALEARIGGKANGSFETSASQLLSLSYASKYGVALTGSARTGIGVGDTLRLLGFTTLTSLALEFSVPLAESPRAQTVTADRASFVAGDPVNVKVTLDPATLNFLPDTYNVKSVQLRRRVGNDSEVLAVQTATTGQREFAFDIVAPHSGQASEWSAFVTTQLLQAELLSLELGAVAAGGVPSVRVVGSSTMSDLVNQRAAACFGSARRTFTSAPNSRSERGGMEFSGPQGGGRTNCVASVPGITARIVAQIGLSGPQVSTTPVSALSASFAGGAELSERLELEIAEAANGWRQQAAANARVEVLGTWLFQAAEAPVAYTVSVAVSAGAGVGMRARVAAPGQEDRNVEVCARPSAPTSTFKTSYCGSSDDPEDALASRTVSGILQPGQTLQIDGQGEVEWHGTMVYTDYGASRVGESGSVESSGRMNFQVMFSAPQ